MVLLYSNKVCELAKNSCTEELDGSLSYLKAREKELLLHLLENYTGEFTPIEVSRGLNVTNKTIINRLANLVKCGFVAPNLARERIRSYELTSFARQHKTEIRELVQ